MLDKWWHRLPLSCQATNLNITSLTTRQYVDNTLISRCDRYSDGSAVLFVVVAITATCLTLIGVASSANRIIDAQRAQVAADAAALSCVIYGTDFAEQAANENGAELVSVDRADEQCQVVVQYRHVLRTAFALSSRNDRVPTMQR